MYQSRLTGLKTSTALVLVLMTSGTDTLAGPTDGQVVGGDATITTPDAQTTVVNQTSARGIIEWNTFNVGSGEQLRFNQPSADAITLNRVTGGQGPSAIDGRIEANGRIIISNRDGIVFGDGAAIDVGALIATTATNGEGGTWLLDPRDITIVDGVTDVADVIISGGQFVPADDADTELSSILIEAQLNAGNRVIVSTQDTSGSEDGDITVATDITKSRGGDAELWLLAEDDIIISRGVDIESNANELDIFLVANDRISAGSMGELDTNGGFLGLRSGDDITIDTRSRMPEMAITNFPEFAASRVDVELDFEDDHVEFSYTDDEITVPTNGFQLLEFSGGPIYIDMDGDRTVSISDRSFLLQDGRADSFQFNHTTSYGVEASDALNGIPEVINFPLSSLAPFGENPPSGITPVVEVSNDEGLTVDRLVAASPAGEVIIAALEVEDEPSEPEPPTEEPSEPEQPEGEPADPETPAEGPSAPEPPMEEPSDPEESVSQLSDPDILAALDGRLEEEGFTWSLGSGTERGISSNSYRREDILGLGFSLGETESVNDVLLVDLSNTRGLTANAGADFLAFESGTSGTVGWDQLSQQAVVDLSHSTEISVIEVTGETGFTDAFNFTEGRLAAEADVLELEAEVEVGVRSPSISNPDIVAVAEGSLEANLAEIETEASGSVRIPFTSIRVGVAGEASGAIGIGAGGELRGELSPERIELSAGVNATVGLGAGLGGRFFVELDQI